MKTCFLSENTKKRSEKCIISHLACIFGIYFCQVSELPGLLSLVEVPLVRFFHFYYFNLDRPLCGNWKSKKNQLLKKLLQKASYPYTLFTAIYMVTTCSTQEAVLLLFSCFADINNAKKTLIIGCEDVPLESMLYGCHDGCCHTETMT